MDCSWRSSEARGRGISLPELLVVIAILALATVVSVPMIGERLVEARNRSAVGQYVVALRAARMVAVTTGAPVAMSVRPAPHSDFEYSDVSGRRQSFRMPDGLRIVSTTGAITFQPNGSSPGGGATVIEAAHVEHPHDRIEIRVPASGIPQVVEIGPGAPVPSP